MMPDMKRHILANVNVKLYSQMLTFCKVVWQQILGKLAVLIQDSSTDPF